MFRETLDQEVMDYVDDLCVEVEECPDQRFAYLLELDLGLPEFNTGQPFVMSDAKVGIPFDMLVVGLGNTEFKPQPIRVQDFATTHANNPLDYYINLSNFPRKEER